jgi:hypothetical protein
VRPFRWNRLDAGAVATEEDSRFGSVSEPQSAQQVANLRFYDRFSFCESLRKLTVTHSLPDTGENWDILPAKVEKGRKPQLVDRVSADQERR